MTKFDAKQLEIVRFCAVKCEMQRSGEASVSNMVNAWHYAADFPRDELNVDFILGLGKYVEPVKNKRGYRQVRVAVGDWTNEKLDWRKIPDAMNNLLDATALPPGEWFREYEEIHPFVDGNGRTGQILFNWLNGSLDAPVWAPNFWDDERRISGRGA